MLRSSLSLLTSLALLMMVGCGGPEGDKPATASTGAKASAAEPFRDRVVIARGADAQKLDPVQMSDYESAQVLSLVAETLLEFAPDSLEISPLLAERYVVEEEGVLWRLTLREGLRFHDGTPCDAAAVVWNLSRFLATSLEDHPAYVPDMPYREALFSDLVESFEASGERDVLIRLKRPYVAFAANLASFPASIVSPASFAKEGEGFARACVGTGPYRLKRWTTNTELHLEANAEYWGEAPMTANLYFKTLLDPNQLFNALVGGEADVVIGISTKFLAALEKREDARVLRAPNLNIGYVAINNENPKFADRRVRQAMNFAVDKVFITQKLFDGTAIPATGAAAPGMMGSLAEPVYPRDLAKAKALLAEAGFEPGQCAVTITSFAQPRSYNPAGERLATVLQQNLAEAGFAAKIELVDFAAALDRSATGAFELLTIGWGSDNGDPDNTFYQVFGVRPNRLRWYDDQAIELMVKAQTERDTEQRRALYEQANRRIIEEAPAIFLNHSQQIVATSAKVEGMALHPTAIHRFQHVRVAR